ncbi:hypothetical protein, partial [Plesiomonas shigelloides]|uniref:hypothetical protein n=1 Tax=Plesiomonas shigelloides TaxID=703 RepID=UPI0031450893
QRIGDSVAGNAGCEIGERTRELPYPEMGGIFKSDSGFATLDLSTGKRLFSVMLVRRAEPLEKSILCAISSPFLMLLFGSSKTSKKLIGRGAHLAVPLIGQRDCA